MRKRLALLLLLAFLLAVVSAAVFAQAEIDNTAEEHILSQLRRAGIPNAAVAVIQGEETSFTLKDSEADTLFAIASVSKPMTAFGVLLLEDMGLLSINDPVNQHLPWFEVRYNDMPVPHEEITISNLIHHTSGIAQNENRFPRAAPAETREEFIARLIGMELDFYPSTNSAYSNMAYVILGLLIEAVSGQSYDDFMTHQVLHPLGLYDTFTNAGRARDTGRVVSGHVRGFLQVRPGTRGLESNTANMPAGGIYSSVSDLARWAGIQLGIVDVPEQFARLVQRSHIPNLDADVSFASGHFSDGGWVVDLENGYIEHSGGGTAGYAATIRIFPESDTAVVVLSNLRGSQVENMGAMALHAVVDGTFTRVGLDFLEWMDMGFTLLLVAGAIYVGLFVRLMLKLRKRLRDGEIVKANVSAISITGLISGPIFSILSLVFYYIFPYVLLDTTRASLVDNWPISFALGFIAIWMFVLYEVFAWWAKVFVNPRYSE